MEGFRVIGGETLRGEARVQGAKNAVLPILAAAILPEGETVIRDCPDIRDAHAMAGILKKLGCECVWQSGEMRISSGGLHHWETAPRYGDVSRRVRDRHPAD